MRTQRHFKEREPSVSIDEEFTGSGLIKDESHEKNKKHLIFFFKKRRR